MPFNVVMQNCFFCSLQGCFFCFSLWTLKVGLMKQKLQPLNQSQTKHMLFNFKLVEDEWSLGFLFCNEIKHKKKSLTLLKRISFTTSTIVCGQNQVHLK